VEEVDAGYTGGSGFEAGGSVFSGDASERVDRGGSSGEAGGVEGFEALARGDEFACDGFVKDGAEEDEVGVVAGLFDLGKGVTGDREDRRREGRGGVQLADLLRGELAGGGGKVNSVGGGGDGDVGAGVDEEFRLGVAEVLEDLAREGGEGSGGKVFFAELDVVDAFGCPSGRLVEEGGELWLPPFTMKL
jgi:hypothetical protein